MTTRRITHTLALTLAVLLAAPDARAADPAAPPAPALVGEASFASVDRVDAAMKKAGFDGYRAAALGMAGNLPFLGAEAVDTTKPIALHLIGGDELKQQEQALFMIPVKPAAAALADFQKQGWQLAPGRTDTVLAPNGFGLRRSADYLYFGALPDLLAKPDEAALAKSYAGAGVLARFAFDVKGMRAAAPKRYAAFFDETLKQQKNDGERAGVQLVKDAADTLDRIDITYSADGELFKHRWVAGPVRIKAPAGAYRRPVFPAGVLGEAHAAIPADDAVPALAAGLTWAWKAGEGEKGALDPKVVRATNDAAAELLLGDVVSVAVEEVGGHLVTYLVVQGARERNFDAEFEKLDKTAAPIAKAEAGGKIWERSTYKAADGQTVNRLTFYDKGSAAAYGDFVVRGKTLVAAFAANDAHHVERLAGLKFEGDVNRLLTGELDMAKFRKALTALGVKGGPPEGTFMSGKLTFAAASADGALTVDLAVPLTFLGDLIKMAGQK